jgi:hypothetical protein
MFLERSRKASLRSPETPLFKLDLFKLDLP